MNRLQYLVDQLCIAALLAAVVLVAHTLATLVWEFLSIYDL